MPFALFMETSCSEESPPAIIATVRFIFCFLVFKFFSSQVFKSLSLLINKLINSQTYNLIYSLLLI